MSLLVELVFPLLSSSLSLLSSSQVVFPPSSPIPLRRTFSVLPSPSPTGPLLHHRKDASARSSSPPPSLPASSTLGPSALPRGSPGVRSAGAGPREDDAQDPTPPTPAPHSVRSVGCQTDEDPLFPSMQAGLGALAPALPVPVLMPELCPHSVCTCAHTHVHTHAPHTHTTHTLCSSIHKPLPGTTAFP